jgi:hypothetical protein
VEQNLSEQNTPLLISKQIFSHLETAKRKQKEEVALTCVTSAISFIVFPLPKQHTITTNELLLLLVQQQPRRPPAVVYVFLMRIYLSSSLCFNQRKQSREQSFLRIPSSEQQQH